MSEMVERVARAISTEVPTCYGATCVFTPLTECACGKIAARAILAMREPTDAMISRCPYLGPEAEGTPEEIWRAMSDGAVDETS